MLIPQNVKEDLRLCTPALDTTVDLRFVPADHAHQIYHPRIRNTGHRLDANVEPTTRSQTKVSMNLFLGHE